MSTASFRSASYLLNHLIGLYYMLKVGAMWHHRSEKEQVMSSTGTSKRKRLLIASLKGYSRAANPIPTRVKLDKEVRSYNISERFSVLGRKFNSELLASLENSVGRREAARIVSMQVAASRKQYIGAGPREKSDGPRLFQGGIEGKSLGEINLGPSDGQAFARSVAGS